MSFLIPFIITTLILAISLVIVSKLPVGVEIDSFGNAVVAGIILGLLNALIRPFAGSILLNVITLGLVSLVLNALVFGIAAVLVPGFRLRWGFLSAILGGLALAIVNGILDRILTMLGFIAAG
ncbi:phage holin family protein [Leptolyngbya sp. AN02str]|uniref:phage holin family protein n=1 Tax=Leptolyngbya sp. AN02str TaxID=3423363 RepID=UPI003D31C40B